MIEEIARVTAVHANNIDVQSDVKSSCSGCKQIDTCGSGQVAQALPKLALSLSLKNSLNVAVGDKVVIGIPEKHLLSTALFVYLFPLIGLIMFSVLGQWLVSQGIISGEPLAIVLGFIGGFIGFLFAKLCLNDPEKSQQLQPKLLRKL